MHYYYFKCINSLNVLCLKGLAPRREVWCVFMGCWQARAARWSWAKHSGANSRSFFLSSPAGMHVNKHKHTKWHAVRVCVYLLLCVSSGCLWAKLHVCDPGQWNSVCMRRRKLRTPRTRKFRWSARPHGHICAARQATRIHSKIQITLEWFQVHNSNTLYICSSSFWSDLLKGDQGVAYICNKKNLCNVCLCRICGDSAGHILWIRWPFNGFNWEWRGVQLGRRRLWKTRPWQQRQTTQTTADRSTAGRGSGAGSKHTHLHVHVNAYLMCLLSFTPLANILFFV